MPRSFLRHGDRGYEEGEPSLSLFWVTFYLIAAHQIEPPGIKPSQTARPMPIWGMISKRRLLYKYHSTAVGLPQDKISTAPFGPCKAVEAASGRVDDDFNDLQLGEIKSGTDISIWLLTPAIAMSLYKRSLEPDLSQLQQQTRLDFIITSKDNIRKNGVSV